MSGSGKRSEVESGHLTRKNAESPENLEANSDKKCVVFKTVKTIVPTQGPN